MIVGLIIATYLLMMPVTAGLLVRFGWAEPEEAIPMCVLWPIFPALGILAGLFILAAGKEYY